MQSLLTAEHKKFIKKFSNQVNQGKSAYKDSIKQLGKQMFTHMSIEEMEMHDIDYWVNTFNLMIRSMSARKLRNPVIEVVNPKSDPTVTQIILVNDNIPFLVDSATMACAEFGLSIKLISHPIIQIKGEDKKRVLIEKPKKGETQAKSLIYIEIKRIEDKTISQQLKDYLVKVFAQIRTAVNDWQPMLEKIAHAKTVLGSLGDDTVRQQQQAFVDWLTDDNFTFLGYRKYDRKRKYLGAVADTGLGLLSPTLDAEANDASQLSVEDYQIKKQSDLVVITKLNVISKIHRKGNLDYIGLLETDEKGQVVAEHRFIGLFTSVAINTNVLKIPYINTKIKVLIKQFGFDSNSHSGKMLMHIIDTMPRDEVLQSNTNELFNAVYQSLVIQEKITTQVTARQDKFNRFCSFMVYVPRDLFNTNTRHKIQALLANAVGGVEVEYAVAIDESHYARLYVVIRDIKHFNAELLGAIKNEVIEVVTTWEDKLAQTLTERLGVNESTRLMAKFKGSFPVAYREDVSPWVASFDVENADKLNGDTDIEMSLYQPRIKRQGDFRFKVFRHHHTIPLSEVLPDLENLGLHVVSERPYELKMANGHSIWVQDFDLSLASGQGLELDLVKSRFHEAFAQVVNGELESDPLNKLIILGGLTWRQINFLRGLVKYLLQTGLPYSKDYIEKAMIQNSHISRWIVELFTVKFLPKLDHVEAKEARSYLDAFGKKFVIQCQHLNVELNQYQQDCVDKYIRSRKFSRGLMSEKITKVINALLNSVKSQDEDRIIRHMVDTIGAILRTNYYQTDSDGQFRPAISIKVDSAALDFLPKPVPFREIFVYSPRVEAIHLRMGKVARGGLRWSDRYEDFRTEVLGLMKAQNVKNSIIVPVGSKGGFVVKNLPNGSREEVMAEVISCYKIFIGSMLDITDNIKGKRIIAPKNVVRHDEDDPYLVVAADKGTATFSDIANGISEERGFWLGDAFASGGSAGYDHKGMGITAKGAWESVKRHFRELGVDCQREDFSVVGIGDMMGDVFGNGMLLSKHICLKAAFNHLHIFLDPNPDSASSWQERERLFKLPRSSWEDYNQELISKGGGIYSRFDKAIPISPEVKAWLRIKEDELAPQDLIKRLLLSEIDLIWNGGIGTYVKASDETHADAGDSANNALRVDGKQLRCKVVGEGGNLGLTQKGRIEYAKNGGKVNTDFIDNSAGVDCSDHEVNIKILLKAMMEDGKYDVKSRNKLLASMTENVSDLVLKNNYMQTQTLSFMEHLSAKRVGAKAHLIRLLESKGLLDRDIEFLPSDSELERRRKNNDGLSRPELCVLLSYSKLDMYEQVMQSKVLNDPWLNRLMVNYFPSKLQKVDAKYLDNHRLKREIIGTIMTSQVIDRMGATFVMRMQEDTGAGVGAICKAFYIVVELFKLDDLWHDIEAHDGQVEVSKQIESFVSIWQFARQTIRWVLNNLGHGLDIQKQINALNKGVNQFRKEFSKYISDVDQAAMNRVINAISKQGFSEALARDIAALPYLSAALDVVKVANEQKVTVKNAADMYFPVGKMLNLIWLQNMIEKLKVNNQWHVHARGGLRDDLTAYHAELTASLIKRYGKNSDAALQTWSEDFGHKVKNVKDMMMSIKHEKNVDYPTIMVAINSLSQLVNATK
ncbi:NAD-glutamate dehydrogenase [Marinicella sp. S1101]|uniref:NAD-glutamate dehydrogenase n=1 Tax=Marinicella marina TaxID=2996016 RepID=UPI002260DEEF|nr:NAD-glutamate dehydrogenase [Marinicella marina]MCX7553472.1 NAD-glutamate dehydrogenase [Marinicella marina]MDJ1140096.1 NAD-glutamate dehydrogenase [Marinicella marina]